jgi:hypothetical protein
MTSSKVLAPGGDGQSGRVSGCAVVKKRGRGWGCIGSHPASRSGNRCSKAVTVQAWNVSDQASSGISVGAMQPPAPSCRSLAV